MAEASVWAKAGLVLLGISCICASCTGKEAAIQSLHPASPQFLPIPIDHTATALNGQRLLGIEAETKTESTIAKDGSLYIDATHSAQPQFAVYLVHSSSVPRSATVLLNSSFTQQAFIGTLDASAERWRFTGPHGGSQIVELSEENLTQLGNIYIAVVSPPGSTAQIDEILVSSENLSPNAVLSVSPWSGNAPLRVTFYATQSSDPDGSIVSYQWDTNEDGLFEPTGNESSREANFYTPGPHTYSVRVTDDSGASAVASTTAYVHGWVKKTIPTGCPVGTSITVATINGKPAVAYQDVSRFDLQYAYCLTDDGLGQWNTLDIDGVGFVGSISRLAQINGKPAIVYASGYSSAANPPDLKFASSLSADGGSGWTNRWIAVDIGELYDLALCQMDGRPAVAYPHRRPQSSYTDLFYSYSEQPAGSGSWLTQTVEEQADGTYGWDLSMVELNGGPALAYSAQVGTGRFELHFARSDSYDASAGWQIAVVDADPNASCGYFASLSLLGDQPAISYLSRQTDFSTSLKFALGLDAMGTNWSTSVINSVGFLDQGVETSLVAYADQIGIAYHAYDPGNEHDLRFARNDAAVSSNWIVSTVDAPAEVHQFASMTVLPGDRPAIACMDRFTRDLVLYVLF